MVSVEELPPGTQILARDLQLPDGSSVDLDPETLIVNITNAPTAEALEAELAEAEAEAGIEPTMAPAAEPTAGRGAGRVRERLAEPAAYAMTSWLVVGAQQSRPGVRSTTSQHRLPGRRGAAPAGWACDFGQCAAYGPRLLTAALDSQGRDAARLIVAKSRTFMNETGWAVTRLLAYSQAAAGPDDRRT